MAAPVIELSTAYIADSTGTSHVVNVPAGLSSGELLFAVVSPGQTASVTADAAFTELNFASATQLRQGLYYLTADGTEPSTYTFTFSTANRAVITMYRISGWDSATAVKLAGPDRITGSATPAGPSITTETNDSLVLHIITTRGGARTFTPPSGTTEEQDNEAGAANDAGVAQGVASEVVATAGPTGATTWTISSSTDSYTSAIALEPTTGAAGQTITGSDYIDPDAFGSGTVAPGTVTITGAVYADIDSFGAGTISQGTVITGAAYIDPDSFGSGTVSPGAVMITGAIYLDPDSFGAGSIAAGTVAITGSIYIDPDTFGSGTVSQGDIITGSTHVDIDAFGSGSITTNVEISGASYLSPNMFGSGTVNPGVVTISGTGIVSVNEFGSGVVTIGSANITGSLYVDIDAFGLGVVTGGSIVIQNTPADRTITIQADIRTLEVDTEIRRFEVLQDDKTIKVAI